MTALIAEIGLAHEGSLWLAHSYLDACAVAGATHVKFQAHTPLESSSDETWRTPPPTCESRAAYWTRTAFTVEQWAQLVGHAHVKGLEFGLSLFHDSLVDDLAPLCDFLKVPSGAATYRPLLDGLARHDKPTYISDGLHDLQDIPDPWVRLICTSKYPCPIEEAGLSEIRPGVDGLSDHTGNPLTAALATYAGAVAVEVHVTFSPWTGLPDAAASLTVEQLAVARQAMTSAHLARTGVRPTPNPLLQTTYSYALRKGTWSKPGV